MDQETLGRLTQMGQRLTEAILIRYIKIFSDLVDKFRTGSDHRILLETALIKLCQPSMDHNVEHLLARIDMLESQVSKMAQEGVQLISPKVKEAAKTEVKEEVPIPVPATPADLQRIKGGWNEVLQKVMADNRFFGHSISHYHLKFSEGEAKVLYLVCDEDSLSLSGDQKDKAEVLIENFIGEIFGVQIKVHLSDANLKRRKQLYEVSLAEKIQETIDFPIEVVDN